MLHNSYWLWDKAISKEVCEKVISENDWNKKTKGTVASKIGEPLINEEARITNVLLETILYFLKEANVNAKWNFDLDSLEHIQIGEYEVGGFYGWHKDIFSPNENNKQRKLSMSILLSDENSFDGGEFEFKDIDDQPILKQGSVLVFPSFLEHQVKVVTRGVRYSAVAWASGPAFR